MIGELLLLLTIEEKKEFVCVKMYKIVLIYKIKIGPGVSNNTIFLPKTRTR